MKISINIFILCGVILSGSSSCYASSTDLFKAVTAGDVIAVRTLLDRGENVNAIEEKYGITPLHMASYQGNTELVRLLIERGANISAKDKEGEMPVHAACNNGKWQAVQILLTSGGDINARTNQGWTPLHYASGSGSKQVVILLIAKGADISARANDGRTSLDLASGNGNKEIIELLESKQGVSKEDSVSSNPVETDDSMTTRQLYDSALAAGLRKDFKASAIFLEKAKLKDPSNIPVAIAFSLAKEAALEKIPAEAGVSIFRSVEAGNAGKWDESLAEAKKASVLATNSAAVWVHLGTVYVGLIQANRGDYYANDAMTAYQKAIEIDPNFGLAHFNLGVALASKREWESAKYHLEKAKALGIFQAENILYEVEKRMPKGRTPGE